MLPPELGMGNAGFGYYVLCSGLKPFFNNRIIKHGVDLFFIIFIAQVLVNSFSFGCHGDNVFLIRAPVFGS